MEKIIGVFTLIVTLAIIAVLVSRRANTAKVVTSVLSGFSGAVKAATSPVTTA